MSYLDEHGKGGEWEERHDANRHAVRDANGDRGCSVGVWEGRWTGDGGSGGQARARVWDRWAWRRVGVVTQDARGR